MKIIIVGGGFAGLNLATELNNKPGVEVLLIDRFNYHQFQPLYYQVATSALDASNISFPLRKIFQKSKNIRFRLADLTAINSASNTISTTIGQFDYDILVIATGADTNFFGNQKLTDCSYPMKTTVEALQMRYKLIQNFEDALLVLHKPEEVEKTLGVVIVGGGATGVEVAGALAEMRNHILPKDYPELDFNLMKIYLLEGSGRLLGAMSEKSSSDAKRYLDRLGVDIRLSTIVKEYDGETVTLTDGSTIEARTVIWAAGIRGNVPSGIDPSLVARGNRIKVDRYNKVLGSTNIYAIGDIAYMETPKYPNGHPQVANVAKNQGKLLAKNVLRLNASQQLEEFEYKDRGSMATVGRGLAVVDLPNKKHFNGAFAWFIWMALHLFLLVGVKNRVQVFVNWIYQYFTYDQSLRLMFKEFYRPSKKVMEAKKS